MMQEWKEHGVSEITEQRLCDQAVTNRKNGWLSDSEVENIRRMIEAESETMNESIENMEEKQTERNIVRTSERNEQIGDDLCETMNNVAVNDEALDEETQLIIAQLKKILAGGRNTDGISFKKVNMNTLNRIKARVKRVIELIETKNITQTNNLIKAAGVWVADQLGLKKSEGRKKKDPWWKRRIEEDIKQLQKDINILERVKNGHIGACKEGKAKLVKEKYGVKRKGLTTVIEELKQRILAKAAKLSRYEQRIQQYRIKGLFKVDHKKVYNEFNGQTESSNKDIPNAEESRTFWSGIWSVEKEYNNQAKWRGDLMEEMVN